MTLTNSSIWNALKAEAQQPRLDHQLKVSACNITIDFSNQHINSTIIELLGALAEKSALKQMKNALHKGEKINYSESRPALHTALRAPFSTVIEVDGQNVMENITATKTQMYAIANKLRQQQWLGFSGQPIKDIVNIGVGGSDLGPRFCVQALGELVSSELNYHFISDADPNGFLRVTAPLNPETTLFIISSKSFTTEETLLNAKKAKQWIGDPSRFTQHFVAVTANIPKASEFGIETILPIWSWVGGRYSLCSAINLITAIAIGQEHFEQILTGAHEMDQHFLNCEFGLNLPTLLALIGIWNNNFLDINNLLMLVYAHELEKFVPYIQQLDMESNGKSRNHQGELVDYATGPIVWGGNGNQAQHSYYQLLCQGTHKVAMDLISVDTFAGEMVNQMCERKVNVLTRGVSSETDLSGEISGNIPLSHIRLRDCSPFTIGALVALFEHKIFTQSVIWNINPFDQPGVESSKRVRLKTEL